MVSVQDDVTYELPGHAGEAKALQYFFVTPNTGELYVRRSLTDDSGRDTQYRVRRIVIWCILASISWMQVAQFHYGYDFVPHLFRILSFIRK